MKSKTYTQSKRPLDKNQSSKFCQSGVKQTHFQNLKEKRKCFFLSQGHFKLIGSWENSTQICKPETKSIPNSPECLDEAMETRKKVLYRFYKIFLKDNSTNEGKYWFFHFLIETDFLDTRSYFLPANQNARLIIHNQSKFV